MFVFNQRIVELKVTRAPPTVKIRNVRYTGQMAEDCVLFLRCHSWCRNTTVNTADRIVWRFQPFHY